MPALSNLMTERAGSDQYLIVGTDIHSNNTVKEGCPLSSKTMRSTGTSYHHLIAIAEIYLSGHEDQIVRESDLAGFQVVTPRHKMCWVTFCAPTFGD